MLVSNKGAVLAALILALVAVTALAAPLIAPYDPLATHPEAIRAAPSSAHWLGTDGSGRDIYSRIIHGSRISLQVAAGAVAASLIAGGVLGIVAGWFGGIWDEVLSRVTDMLFAFPDIVLALVIMAALEPSRGNLILAIGIVYTPIFARLARGSVLSIKAEPFVEAAHAAGLPTQRIVVRHVLPNIAAPLTVQVTLSLGFAILAEAALSFLGLGVEADAPSWGNMLMEGRELMRHGLWWVAVFPGLAITLVVFAFNILGDGLRDALDPRFQ